MVEQQKTIKCRFCKSTKTIKKGLRKTINRGKIQVYKCLECNRKFTNDEGFYRMRNSEEKITAGIDLYFSNLSSRKVRNHFRRHLTHNSSHVTILDWCRKYTLKVSNYVDKLQPQLSGKVYADETEIKRGKKNDIFWCSVDWDTRFINSTMYTPNAQNVEDAKTFLKNIRKSVMPKYIQTDAGVFYPKAFIKVFGSSKLKKNDCKHIVVNYGKTGLHNVRIETVFSKIKDRTIDFRSLKALWSAPILMQGIILQHNFIEAHTTTGKVPCELAGITPITENNRWLGLIRKSSMI